MYQTKFPRPREDGSHVGRSPEDGLLCGVGETSLASPVSRTTDRMSISKLCLTGSLDVVIISDGEVINSGSPKVTQSITSSGSKISLGEK